MTKGELDRNVVQRHLLALDRALRHLERHRGKSRDELDRELMRHLLNDSLDDFRFLAERIEGYINSHPT